MHLCYVWLIVLLISERDLLVGVWVWCVGVACVCGGCVEVGWVRVCARGVCVGMCGVGVRCVWGCGVCVCVGGVGVCVCVRVCKKSF